MAVRNVLLFRGAGNILNFKVLFCVDGKLLCKAFSLCRQPLLHFFRLVQIAAKALSFAVVLAVEVVQDHCLTAAEFFDFFSQCGGLLGMLTALGDLQQGTELNEELVHTLIEKIIVHEKEIINSETVMSIEIYYRFIGKTSDCFNRSVTPIKTKTESVAATDSID